MSESNERDWAEVTVRVWAATYSTESGRKWATEAYDLHLFRDGRLVGQCPEPKEGAERTPEGNDEASRERWRDATRVVGSGDARAVKDKDGAATVRFKVKLPRSARGKPVFTAYAFNSDRVRSAVAEGGAIRTAN